MITIKQTFLLSLLLLIGVIGVTLALPSSVQAASCGTQETSILACDDSTNGVWGVLLLVINFLAGGVGLLVVGAIIYGGLLYSSSNGNSAQTSKAVSIIRNAVIGVLIFIFMYAILQFVIPGGFIDTLLNPPANNPKASQGQGNVTRDRSGNVQHDATVKTIRTTHLHSSGRFDRSTRQWRSDLLKLRKEYSPDVITLTEALNRGSAIDWKGWASTKSESIVAWDTTVWKKRGAEVKLLAPNVSYFRRITASIVVLEHRQTKTKWLWVSCHLPSSVDKGNGNFDDDETRVTKWKASMRDLSEAVNATMQAFDIKRRHSVIAADWNINLAQDAWRDVMSGYFPNRAPSNSVGSAGTHGNRTIDSSLVTSDVDVSTWRSLGTIPSSDHKPFLAKYKADK